MNRFSLYIFLLLLPILLSCADNDSYIKQQIIRDSISSHKGECLCPYNRDSSGRKCGKRSIYSKAKTPSLFCYESDISETVLRNYKLKSSSENESKQFLRAKKENIINGKVIRVADGDTITIINSEYKQTKIRLYGIDAPEKAQDFGNVSREYLAELVAGKTIDVTVINIDRYGRSVGRIKVDDKEVAEEMLKSGLAWLYTAYCKIPECKQWKQLETQAKTAKIGLWSNPISQEPWKWRKEHK